MTDRETQLREAIRRIVDDAQARCQPYLDELVRLETFKPPMPTLLTECIRCEHMKVAGLQCINCGDNDV